MVVPVRRRREENEQFNYELIDKSIIDNSKLDVKIARKFGSATCLSLTEYLDLGKKYIVDKKLYKRKLNGEDRVLTEIVIQSIDDAKLICQNWNDTKCEDCEALKLEGCELNRVE